MAEIDFETSFRMQMNVMKLCQCHPDTIVTKSWFLLNLMAFTPYVSCFYVLVNCTLLYLNADDYFNAFRNIVPVTFFICISFYYCLLMINRTTSGNLIKSVKNDYKKALAMDIRRKNIIIEHVTRGRNIMYIWCFLMLGGAVVFVVKSMVLTFHYTRKYDKLTLVPFHEMEYPFGIDEYKNNNIYVFACCFVFEMYFLSVSAFIYTSTVPLGLIFMVHACGQMELIKLQFENIFEQDNVENRLKEIVKDLQYVYSFVKGINMCYTVVYEILLKQSMLLLPFTSYAIIQSINHGTLTIEYGALFIQAVFTSSIPCYYGDLLMEKGEEVRQVAYSCGWERVSDIKARKTLLLILTRAQRPVGIETIFTKICLDTLTNVYRQAYTIFNLMTAMW